METCDALLGIYDKRRGSCYSQHINQCEIEEHDTRQASFHRLYIQNVGARLDKFDTDYVTDYTGITEKSSSIIKDSKCDGVVLIRGNDKHTHMVLAELKSKHTADNLRKAFLQIVHTLFKYRQLFSICDSCSFSDMSVDCVLACNATDDNSISESYLEIQDKQMLSEENKSKNFVADILPVLLKDKKCTFCIGEIDMFNQYPFNKELMNKPIELHLATSSSPKTDSATICFTY